MINIIVGSIAAGALGGIIGATSEISKFLKNKLTKPSPHPVVGVEVSSFLSTNLAPFLTLDLITFLNIPFVFAKPEAVAAPRLPITAILPKAEDGDALVRERVFFRLMGW
jgi:hypothetical protein